jgi:hypothetical protein
MAMATACCISRLWTTRSGVAAVEAMAVRSSPSLTRPSRRLRESIRSSEQLMAMRWIQVVNVARASKRSRARYARRNVSWTTSSASALLPVMRYAER